MYFLTLNPLGYLGWAGFILSLILGSCIGSFAACVLYRWPRNLSLLNPPSFCEGCQKKLTIFSNIPIFGALVNRGKCTECKHYFGYRSFWIEVFTAIIYGLTYLFSPSIDLLIFWFVLLWILMPLFFIDLAFRFLPDEGTVLAIIWVLLFYLYLNFAYNIPFYYWSFNIVPAFLFLGLGLLLSILLKKEAFGLGDIFLLFSIAPALLNVELAFIAFFASAFLGLIFLFPIRYFSSVLGGDFRFEGDHDLVEQFAFGPALIMSFWIFYLAGNYMITINQVIHEENLNKIERVLNTHFIQYLI